MEMWNTNRGDVCGICDELSATERPLCRISTCFHKFCLGCLLKAMLKRCPECEAPFSSLFLPVLGRCEETFTDKVLLEDLMAPPHPHKKQKNDLEESELQHVEDQFKQENEAEEESEQLQHVEYQFPLPRGRGGRALRRRGLA